jgi:hypothetical protein
MSLRRAFRGLFTPISGLFSRPPERPTIHSFGALLDESELRRRFDPGSRGNRDGRDNHPISSASTLSEIKRQIIAYTAASCDAVVSDTRRMLTTLAADTAALPQTTHDGRCMRA